MDIKSRRLPSAYQEVEWIGCDGNQYIITNLIDVVGTRDFRIDTEIQVSTHTQYRGILGNKGAAAAAKGFELYVSTPYINRVIYSIATGTSSYETTITISDYTSEVFHTMSMVRDSNDTQNVGYILCDGIRYNQSYGNNIITDVDTGNNIRLFSPNATEYCFVGKCKYISFYVDDVLLLDTIPCYRKSDNKIGMYDLVNDTFYTNQGSGTFTKGADVVTVDKIHGKNLFSCSRSDLRKHTIADLELNETLGLISYTGSGVASIYVGNIKSYVAGDYVFSFTLDVRAYCIFGWNQGSFSIDNTSINTPHTQSANFFGTQNGGYIAVYPGINTYYIHSDTDFCVGFAPLNEKTTFSSIQIEENSTPTDFEAYYDVSKIVDGNENAIWKKWKPKGALYWDGDECVDVTGGWYLGVFNQNMAVEKLPDSMHLYTTISYDGRHRARANTVNKIDITNYTTLNVEMFDTSATTTETSYFRSFGLVPTEETLPVWGGNAPSIGRYYSNSLIDDGVKTSDINNLSGEFYVCILNAMTRNTYISKIWLE